MSQRLTPIQIEILIHYNYSPEDYRDGDFSAPAVCECIALFLLLNLLEDNQPPRDVNDNSKYRITDRGQAHVEALCSVPLPVNTWVSPIKEG